MTHREHYITVAFVFIAGLIGGFMIAGHTDVSGHSHAPVEMDSDSHEHGDHVH